MIVWLHLVFPATFYDLLVELQVSSYILPGTEVAVAVAMQRYQIVFTFFFK
jgi:hypothetical protein